MLRDMARQRVLHLDLGPDFRGGQRQVLYLAGSQAGRGPWEPLLACPTGSPLLIEARSRNLQTEALPSRWDYDPRNWLSLLGLIRRVSAAIIHTHEPRAAGLGAFLSFLLPGKIRLVHTRRVSYPPSQTGFWKYRRGGAVVCVSREILEIMAQCGVERNRLHVRHSAIDPGRYRPCRDRISPLPVICLMGALTAQKGHAVLLRALAGMQDLPWEAVLVGKGPLRGELEVLARDLGISERVRFPGHVDSRLVLPEADVLVVPSQDGEGSSAAIKEGWVCGVPVVASDLPSNLELVQDGLTGLVFPRAEASALGLVLRRILTDDALRSSVVERAIQESALYTVEAMASDYARVYAKLTGFGA
ncbi:MAG: glycosyltransferase family 1 protein [Deltaproteobacteria bacterium]|nr:glycosyltransferase family 1 protein [Deltaproteobacteria bacterium]